MRQVRENLFLGDITDAYSVLQSAPPKVTHLLSVFVDELLSNENFGNLCSLVTMDTALNPQSVPLVIPKGNSVQSLESQVGGAVVDEDAARKRELIRKTVPLRDMESENLLDHLESCLDFIEEGTKAGGSVLVHCLAGISRSASVVTAYLMRTENLPLIHALASLREVSQGVCPNNGFMDQLRMFEEMGFKVDKESPMYKQFHATISASPANYTTGFSWHSFWGQSSFTKHVHNVAPPGKGGKPMGNGTSSKDSSGVAPIRVRMLRLWRRESDPK